MTPEARRALENLIVRSIADTVVDEMRGNLTEQRYAENGETVYGAPLMAWRALFRDRSDGRRRVEGDRTNSDVPLVDTRRLHDSIAVGEISPPSPSRTGDRNGTSYTIRIVAQGYGLDYVRERTFHNVILARDQSRRRSRNFDGLRNQYDYVIKEQLTVPGRPWNAFSTTHLNRIALAAVQRLGA